MKDDLEIDEENGELLCDECKGRGSVDSYPHANSLRTICWKCQGDGKVDWVSHITGKPEREDIFGYAHSTSFDFSRSGYSVGVCGTYDYKLAEKQSQMIADKVDEEIMDNIRNSYQQTYVEEKKAEEDTLGNRIISKFMFYPYIKQIFKGKENKGSIS